ncbi:MAG: hypothetical protein AAGI72_23750 [Pseudomonadota bacterium]
MDHLGRRIAKALGLDTSEVTRLQIDLPASSSPTVTASLLVRSHERSDELVEIVREYSLVPNEEPSAGT